MKENRKNKIKCGKCEQTFLVDKKNIKNLKNKKIICPHCSNKYFIKKVDLCKKGKK